MALKASGDALRLGEFYPKCGENVKLSQDRPRRNEGNSNAFSVAFSNNPIPKRLKFSVKIFQEDSFLVSLISASTRLRTLDAAYVHRRRCCACSPLLPILCTK